MDYIEILVHNKWKFGIDFIVKYKILCVLNLLLILLKLILRLFEII